MPEKGDGNVKDPPASIWITDQSKNKTPLELPTNTKRRARRPAVISLYKRRPAELADYVVEVLDSFIDTLAFPSPDKAPEEIFVADPLRALSEMQNSTGSAAKENEYGARNWSARKISSRTLSALAKASVSMNSRASDSRPFRAIDQTVAYVFSYCAS